MRYSFKTIILIRLLPKPFRVTFVFSKLRKPHNFGEFEKILFPPNFVSSTRRPVLYVGYKFSYGFRPCGLSARFSREIVYSHAVPRDSRGSITTGLSRTTRAFVPGSRRCRPGDSSVGTPTIIASRGRQRAPRTFATENNDFVPIPRLGV